MKNICACGSKDIAGYLVLAEIERIAICQKCIDDRNRQLKKLINSEEYKKSQKELKEALEVNKRIICNLGGCTKYCGEEHD